MAVRYCLLRAIGCTQSANVSVRDDVHLLGVSGLRIGENVSIHPMCYIDATGGVFIGHDVSVAHSTTIMSTTHLFERLDVPIKDQGTTSHPTVIEDGCWIGAHSVILAGVRIGSGSVVAANSVVNCDIPPRMVVAGSPAKVVGSRGVA